MRHAPGCVRVHSETQTRHESTLVDNMRVVPAYHWPQSVSYAGLAVSAVATACIFLGVDAVAEGINEHETVMAVGFAAFTLMMTLLLPVGIRLAGFRRIRRSARISTAPTTHGTGVSIPTGRSVLLLIAALGCVAVAGLVTSASWHFELGESLFLASRDDQAGANVMGAFGAVALLCAVFLLTFRSPAVLLLTPSGVEHHERRYRGFRSTNVDGVAAWSDIIAIEPETLIVRSNGPDVHNPQVRVTYRGGDSSQMDSVAERDFLIQAHLMVAEPNTLYSLMKHMDEHPEDRDLLAREDAVQLLTPPPLRERFRAAREAKKAEKTKKRANG